MAGFIFPAHPESSLKIRPDSAQILDDERLKGERVWVAQRKFNGWHSVIHMHKAKNICNIWHRSGEPFTKYQMTAEMRQCFFDGIKVDPNIEVVLNGELVHGQAISAITGQQALTNTIILFDVLYVKQQLLVEDFGQRLSILNDICGQPSVLEPKKRGLPVAQYGESSLWVAETFADDFVYRFYEMYDFDSHGRDKFPEIEGLVCKKIKNSRLLLGNRPYDVSWMMRVRKTKEKVYLF